jgi:NAD dependent epimerase/dehydratase
VKLLVTGAGGFIGSHLTELLVRDGHDVRAMVIYDSLDSRGWLEVLPADVQAAIEVVSGDIRDANFVRTVMQQRDAVLNLAALIAIPYSYVAPESYVQTNVIGTLNVVQAARDFGLSKVVHVSTSEVYGTAQFVPITEAHPVVGQSPYSATKIAADQLALSFWRSFGTPVAVARPFNTYGPRQSTRAVIPTIITQIAAGAKAIELGSLHPTRDFSFVEDTVYGLMAVLRSDKAVGEVINLGSGFEVSIGETAALIADVMGAQIDITEKDERKRPALSEVERLWASNEKAAKLLSWSPRFGGRDGFREGLRQTAAWFAEPANLARYRVGTYSL